VQAEHATITTGSLPSIKAMDKDTAELEGLDQSQAMVPLGGSKLELDA
jgi:hypothetical protein